jgi:hypothetical protein
VQLLLYVIAFFDLMFTWTPVKLATICFAFIQDAHPCCAQVVVKLQGFPAMGDVPPGLISRLQSSLSRCQALMGAEAYAVVSCAAHLGSMCIVLEVQHQQEQHTHAQQPHSTQQHTAAVKLAGALVSEIAHDMRLSGPEHASSQTAYIQVSRFQVVVHRMAR